MLDRIDIHIEVPRVDYEKLSDSRLGESSAAIRSRVEAAQERQRRRFSDSANQQIAQSPNRITCNADMRPADIRKHCQLDGTSQSVMRFAMSQFALFLAPLSAGRITVC